jgi:hypothetical protein
MKTIFYSAFALFIAVISFSSCGSKTDETVPAGMQLVDLSKYGKPFTLLAPDSNTAKGTLQIIEQNYMLEVRVGKSFGLVIEEGEGNMEQKKTDLKEDEINKFKSYLVDEPTMIAWQSEITKPEYHLYAIVTVGNAKYIISDLNSTDNEPYSEKDIKQMIEAVKSIKEKKKDA